MRRSVSPLLILLATGFMVFLGCDERNSVSPEALAPEPLQAAAPTAANRSAMVDRDLLRLDSDLLPVVQALRTTPSPAPLIRAVWPGGGPALPHDSELGTASGTQLGTQLNWWFAAGPDKGPFRFTPIPDAAPLPYGVMAASPNPAVLSTLALLDVSVGEVLRLSFTFDRAAESLTEPLQPVAWLELKRPLPTETVLSGERARRFLDDLQDRAVMVPASESGPDTASYSSWLSVGADTQQLALLIPRKVPGMRLKDVLIARRSLSDFHRAVSHGEGQFTHERSTPDAHSRSVASLDREERPALQLPPNTQLTWTIPAHSRPYRFEASLGLLPRDAQLGGALQLTIRGDGFTLLEQQSAGSGESDTPAWTPLAFDVPLGTQQLTVEARWPQGDGPLAVLGHPRLRRAPLKPRRNLLIVSLDTLRSDRLGCYGGSAPSEHIDAFAETAQRFENAYSTSSYTLPSHASLLTGQLPVVHGARGTRDHLDRERSPLLSQVLANAGWVTAAFTGGAFLSTSYGFGEGFDRFSHNDPGWPVDTLRGRMLLDIPPHESSSYELELLQRYNVDHVSQWIDGQSAGAPFFALVHTYAVHDYAPNRRWLERSGLLAEDGDELLLDRSAYHAWKAGDASQREAVTAEFSRFYDACIGGADEFMGRLLDSLDDAGLRENTVVVILSDHGEELGELDVFGHGRSLHEGVTRIPLLVRIPGRAAEVISPTVSLADLAPWLLQQLGVSPDPAMLPAPALATDLDDPPGRTTTFFDLQTMGEDQWAVRSGRFKLWQQGDHGEAQLYDLDGPTAEQLDVSEQHPDVRAKLERMLQSYRSLRAVGASKDSQDLDVETRRKLEQLGYLQGDG
ncbi:MAG: arylsulfatase A-like enzyme [Pseudohongiellaceae bacterium]|jgi:arylsulfatase A-like enzyme